MQFLGAFISQASPKLSQNYPIEPILRWLSNIFSSILNADESFHIVFLELT